MTSEGEPDVDVRFGAVDGFANRHEFQEVFGPDDVRFLIPGLAGFRARGGTEITVDPVDDASLVDLLLYLSGSVFGAIWLQRGMFPLHGSTLCRGAASVSFVGPSGAGKSTISAHLAERGWTLVADDVSVLRAGAAGWTVWPGSDRVKLTPDAVALLDQDPASLARAGGARNKYQVRLPAVADADSVPVLKRVYLLASGVVAVDLAPIRGLAAVDVLAGHTYRQEFVRPMGRQATWLAQVARLARAIPVVRLARPWGVDRMGQVAAAIDADLAAA